MDSIEKCLQDMIDKGLASTTSSWIERAVEQRNNKLTVALASSVPIKYSSLDIILLQRLILN